MLDLALHLPVAAHSGRITGWVQAGTHNQSVLSPEIEKGTFFVTPCRDDEEEVDNDGDGGDSGAR